MTDELFKKYIEYIYKFLDEKNLFFLRTKWNIYLDDNVLINISSENIPHLLGYQYISYFQKSNDNLQSLKIFLKKVINGNIKLNSLKNVIYTNFTKGKNTKNWKVKNSKELIFFIENKIIAFRKLIINVENIKNSNFFIKDNYKKYDMIFVFNNGQKECLFFSLCLKNITGKDYTYKTFKPISLQLMDLKNVQLNKIKKIYQNFKNNVNKI